MEVRREVDRGGATAVSGLAAAGGARLGLLARVRGRRISKPSDKGSANRQQKYVTTSDVVTCCDHLMAVPSNRSRIAIDLLRHSYRDPSRLFLTTMKIKETRSLRSKRPRITMRR